MTDKGLPIQIKELLQLTTLGIDESRITYGILTMSSDKFICSRKKLGPPSQFVIIDMANPTHLVRRGFYAIYATMNPASRIIAMEARNCVDLFNLETESTMKRHITSDPLRFVKWINADTLALVTDTEVFHWSTEGESQPKRMFDVHSSFKDCSFQDYRCDDKLQWFLLIGVSRKDPYDGKMQLHSVQRNASQIIVGHAAAFTCFKFEGNPEPSTLLCFAFRTPQGGKLHIKELGQPPRGHQPYTEKAVDVYFPPEAKDDIPISMQTSSKHGIIYLITRCGYVHLYDVETASLIYTSRMSDHDILVTVPHEATSGIIGVNKEGQVLSVSVDEDNFIPYIKNVLKNPDLALGMAVRNNLPGAEDLFLQKFNTLRSRGQHAEAEKLAQKARKVLSVSVDEDNFIPYIKNVLKNPDLALGMAVRNNLPGAEDLFLQKFNTLRSRGQHAEAEKLAQKARKLEKICKENDILLGKHTAKPQQIRNEDISLPNTVEELQFYCLQKQEELISIIAAKEKIEESLRGDIQILKNQLISEQRAKEKLDDTFTQELDSIREQLGILESVKQELELQHGQKMELDEQLVSLKEILREKEEEIISLQAQVEELTTAKAYSSVLYQTDVQDPAAAISREDPPVQQELSGSSSLSKEAVKQPSVSIGCQVPETIQMSSDSEDTIHLQALSRDFAKLLNESPYCDVKITCDGRTFGAHRNVLTARSAVLSAILKKDMVEERESDVTTTRQASNEIQVSPDSNKTSQLTDVSRGSSNSLAVDLKVLSNSLVRKRSNCDVKITCDGRTFNFERNVLATLLTRLSAMLKSDMAESKSGVIKMEDMEASLFQSFLCYLYSGTLPELDVESAKKFYEVADKYAVKELKEACSKFLTENLSRSTACEFLILADKHNDEHFRKIVISYIIEQKIPEDVDESCWLDFSKSYPSLAIQVVNIYLRRNRVN